MSRWVDSLELNLALEVVAMLGPRHRLEDAAHLRRHLLRVRAERRNGHSGNYVNGASFHVADGNGKSVRPEKWGPTIPTSRIRPILERRYVRGGKVAREFAIEDLAHRSGVGFREVKRVLRGSADEVSFGVADALLCAVGEPGAWQAELADLYELDVAA